MEVFSWMNIGHWPMQQVKNRLSALRGGSMYLPVLFRELVDQHLEYV
jgi:hypothetical protein